MEGRAACPQATVGAVGTPRPTGFQRDTAGRLRPAARTDVRGHGGQSGAPGTVILVFVFLAVFILYYFANWKVLSMIWKIG